MTSLVVCGVGKVTPVTHSEHVTIVVTATSEVDHPGLPVDTAQVKGFTFCPLSPIVVSSFVAHGVEMGRAVAKDPRRHGGA